ncbi:hypothetical protein EDC01DRAFT_434131 [Geopyxis carbonaria]|nr:hypothetical protein EDC01DRAFT_434131 [Geopyxis carbonaria]
MVRCGIVANRGVNFRRRERGERGGGAPLAARNTVYTAFQRCISTAYATRTLPRSDASDVSDASVVVLCDTPPYRYPSAHTLPVPPVSPVSPVSPVPPRGHHGSIPQTQNHGTTTTFPSFTVTHHHPPSPSVVIRRQLAEYIRALHAPFVYLSAMRTNTVVTLNQLFVMYQNCHTQDSIPPPDFALLLRPILNWCVNCAVAITIFLIRRSITVTGRHVTRRRRAHCIMQRCRALSSGRSYPHPYRRCCVGPAGVCMEMMFICRSALSCSAIWVWMDGGMQGMWG